jgi:hypothetical protein
MCKGFKSVRLLGKTDKSLLYNFLTKIIFAVNHWRQQIQYKKLKYADKARKPTLYSAIFIDLFRAISFFYVL